MKTKGTIVCKNVDSIFNSVVTITINIPINVNLFDFTEKNYQCKKLLLTKNVYNFLKENNYKQLEY